MTADAPAADRPPPPRRRLVWALLGVLVVMLAALVGLVRFGSQTPWGRGFLESRLEGFSLGRLGRLHIEGFRGDIWSDFSIGRLTIDDGHGAWLDARSIRIRWNSIPLFARRLAIDEADIGRLTLLRRPILTTSAGGGGPSPVSVHLAKLIARVETEPAFSERYGLYGVTANLDAGRRGGFAGRANVASLTHTGDRVDAAFDLGRDKTVFLQLNAREANGGAIAGSLGLAADQPFMVQALAHGTTSQGGFSLTTRSGATSPAEAVGAWSPGGGQAHGRLTLAASRLLSGYQHMVGPEAAFQISGARVADGFEALEVSATSENVDLTARGEADLGRRQSGPKGLSVNIVARQAQRVIGWPAMGGGRFAGVFTLQPDRWSLAGDGAVDAPQALGYRLAQVAGPVRLSQQGGDTTLQANVTGAAGQGQGVITALLGGRPHAAAEVVWLAKGGMLIKSLAVDGAGLRVTGQGDRGLLGGLSFKGRASFSNLQAAHAGAKGLLTASWTASQSGSAPWSFSYDAKAKDFASGVGLLDHLLGPAPALKGAATLDARGWELADAHLVGASGEVTADGLVTGDGELALKTLWRAEGPIEAGPLEVSGAAQGTGSVSGSFSNPRADIAARFESLGLPGLELSQARLALTFAAGPSDTNGNFTLAANSAYGPAAAASSFRILNDGFGLSGLSAEAGGGKVTGAVLLRGGAPSSADLAVGVGPGAFLTRGAASGRLQVTEAAGGAHARLRLAATGASLRNSDLIVQTADLTADGPLASLPYRLQAAGYTSHGSWRANGSGAITDAANAYGATFEGAGRLRNTDFKTLSPAVLKVSGADRSFAMLAEVGGGRAQVDLRQTGAAMNAKANLSGVALGLLEPDFDGRFDADIALQGEGGQLGGELQAKLTDAGEKGAKDQPTVSGLINAHLAGDAMTLDAQLGDNQGLASRAHLVLPAKASAAPFRIAIARDQPMRGDFTADGEIKPLWDLVLGGDRSLGGVAHAHGTIAGTISDPEAQGEARIENGQFSDAETGLKLRNVSLDATLQKDAISVNQFGGVDGAGGQVSGSGKINLQRGGVSSFRLDLKGFRLLDNDIATAAASGQATISRAADGSVKLTGALTIDRADVAANPPTPSGVTVMDVQEINRQVGAGGHLQAVNAHAPAIALDVTLKSARGVFLKGRGLNVELALDAHVKGSTAAPDLEGVAKVVRGDYDFAGKRFQFDNRGVVHLATDAENILLDLTATRDDPSLTAVIRIEGTAAKPKITLTSTPVLPNDEVLSQVLFGTSASQLGPGDAAELASAVSSLAGGSGFDVMGNLRSFAHLDRLAMGAGSEGGVAVSGGKYVTDNVYLELTGGGREGPSGAVEWRVRKDLSVVSRIAGSGGDSQVEVRWRKDF